MGFLNSFSAVVFAAMIGADDAFGAAAVPIKQPRGTVTTDIVDGVDAFDVIANDNDALTEQFKAVPIANIGDVADMADDLPTWPNDAFHFNAEEIWVIIDPSRQTLPFTLIEVHTMIGKHYTSLFYGRITKP